MRIAICEDRTEDVSRLSKLLVRCLRSEGLEADVDVFSSGEALLKSFKPGKYQIIFQDIYLKQDGINGMKTAERIRNIDDAVSIIFTTTSTEHGPTSYEVKADYYIVKPVDKERLEKALSRCKSQIDRYARTIDISTNWQSMKLRLKDVYYAEVIKNNVVFHTMTGAIVSRMTFADLLEKLDGSSFIHCHRSYVVNLVHAADIRDSSIILNNGAQIAISRTYEKQTKQAFKKFAFD